MKTLVLVDYGSGNLRSAAKAFERAVADSHLPLAVVVTDDPAQIRAADRIVLPGVGAFGDCRAGLGAHPGLYRALTDTVIGQRRPFMGICVGMQLMATTGLEHGHHDGLGWVPGVVDRLIGGPGLKIPHMGWNSLTLCASGTAHPVLQGLDTEAQVYFVHSYAFQPDRMDHCLATTDYGQTIPAVIGRDNIIGVQFHPEKSQRVGQALLRNFLTWTPNP